jgi:hypothetical protein
MIAGARSVTTRIQGRLSRRLRRRCGRLSEYRKLARREKHHADKCYSGWLDPDRWHPDAFQLRRSQDGRRPKVVISSPSASTSFRIYAAFIPETASHAGIKSGAGLSAIMP